MYIYISFIKKYGLACHSVVVICGHYSCVGQVLVFLPWKIIYLMLINKTFLLVRVIERNKELVSGGIYTFC